MNSSKHKISLFVYNEKLAAEWHPTKNKELTPQNVFPKSHKQVWWRCNNCEHEWQAAISSRSNGSGCPNCREMQRKESLVINKIKKYGSLSDSHPELSAEWNYKKNIGLTPLQTHHGSSNSVWWECERGHEWKAKITDRVRGNGCPYCSGRYATKDKNLLTHNPSLALEWDYNKNFGLLPADVTPTSHKLVWWKCRKGLHPSFQATVNARSRNTGCPYCSGKRVCNENSLATLNPLLADEWDYNKNGNLTPKDVVLHSGKKVWWKCSNGHPSWKAVINSRVEGRGCPICAKELKTSFPEQVIFFYLNKLFNNIENGFMLIIGNKQYEIDVFIPEYNIGIEYDGQRYHSNPSNIIKDELKNKVLNENNIQLIRIREIGCPAIKSFGSLIIEYDHRKESLLEIAIDELIHHINSIIGIKYISDINIKRDRSDIYDQYIRSIKENSLANKNPKLITEWDYKKNKISPYMISSAAGKKVWWLCPAGCPSYQASPSERNRGRGCPYCAGKKIWKGNSLAELKPELLKEWDFEKNKISPEMVSSASGKKVWWLCPAGCPSYQASPSERNRGRSCPYCAGKKVWEDNSLAKLKPELLKEWDFEKNKNLLPENFTISSGKKVWWKCLKGHPSWFATIADRNTGYGCPYCANQKVCDENSLAILYPDLSEQWHPEKNIELTPKIVTPGSDRKVWWKCEHGHEWQAIIKSRVKGNGCPHCYNERRGKK